MKFHLGLRSVSKISSGFTPSFSPVRGFSMVALAAATGLVLAGCKPSAGSGQGGAGGADAGETIKVGEFACLTGQNASFGQSSHNGTIMAIDEINAAGGVLDKKIQLITEDNQSKGGETAIVVEKLIARDKVVAVLGEVASSRSLEAAPIAQEAEIPMISPASTNPAVTETGDYVFRVCFIDPFQGTVMAKFTLNTLKAKRVAVMTDVKQDYSVGLTKFFVEYLTQNGGTIVSDQKYSSGDKDFRAQLTALRGANPEAVFIPGYYAEAGLIAKQARELGITVPLLGGDGWDGASTLEVGGEALQNTYFSNHFSAEDTNPKIQEFVTKYRERFGATPDAFAALGYDSGKILADAIRRAGSTEGPALRDAIAATKDFEGITGVITLDEKRNANKPAVILKYQNGAYVFAETVAP